MTEPDKPSSAPDEPEPDTRAWDGRGGAEDAEELDVDVELGDDELEVDVEPATQVAARAPAPPRPPPPAPSRRALDSATDVHEIASAPVTSPALPPTVDAPPSAPPRPRLSSAFFESADAAVLRLREEAEAHADPARRARLLAEAANLVELAGDEAGAARDFLDAFNADTTFREALEALLRLLERRRSHANLGKLVEALVSAAERPEERARALLMRAAFLRDVQDDAEGARGAARDATEVDAPPVDLDPAWLTLEATAAALGDAPVRDEALAARADAAVDPRVRALLRVSAAQLAARGGDATRALELLAPVVEGDDGDDGGGGRHGDETAAGAVERALELWERIAREPALDPAERRARARALADVLERRADRARAAKTPATNDEPARVAEADWRLRCALAAAVGGELGRAARALDALLDDPTSVASLPDEVVSLVVRARLRVAEALGDTSRAAGLARSELDREDDPEGRASLALRAAEHAASTSDAAGAIAAVGDAVRAHARCIPARALELDLLADVGDPAELAAALEAFAGELEEPEARVRQHVLTAYVRGVRLDDPEGEAAALGRAAADGLSVETVARLARLFAGLRDDGPGFAAATRRLAATLPDEAEGARALLWLELARRARRDGDAEAADDALARVGAAARARPLGRLLLAFTFADRAALDDVLADLPDGPTRASLGALAAIRATEAGDLATAARHLDAIAEGDPGDPVVQGFLADVRRRLGDRAAAVDANLALAATAGAREPGFAAELELEASFEAWSLGARARAVSALENASRTLPAARRVLGWALWGLAAETDGAADVRRRALAHAAASGRDAAPVALERFAAALAAGEGAVAVEHLEDAETDEGPLGLAAALATLLVDDGPAASHERARERVALDAGPPGRLLATLERLRASDDDARDAIAAARALHDDVDPTAGAVEWLAAARRHGADDDARSARRALGASLGAPSAFAASAALAGALGGHAPATPPRARLDGTTPELALAELERTPPGSTPRARARALVAGARALGDVGGDDVAALAGWSLLAGGEVDAAVAAFRSATLARPQDLHAWEGLRLAAGRAGDREALATACEQIGARVRDDARGSAFLALAASTWFELGEGGDARGEAALDAAFERDRTNVEAFDRLFRRVRERRDGTKLLALAQARLEVVDDGGGGDQEIAKLHWERARVLRERGDPEAALLALENVVEREPDHVGALALTGEIFLKRGMFEEAADKLTDLLQVEHAPSKNRITAGVAAADVYENKLGRPDDAMAVLLYLHRAGLSSLAVKERLARSTARLGAWAEATEILEVLMRERPEREGRVEAARLAAAIHRDRLGAPAAAVPALSTLLDEAPGDPEALDALLALGGDPAARRPYLERGRAAIHAELLRAPRDLAKLHLLARLSHALGDGVLEHAALAACVAVGGPDGQTEAMLAMQSAAKARVPQVAFDLRLLGAVLAPGDDGPIAELFALLSGTLAEAFGPSLVGLGVTKKDRVDPRSGLALRAEVAAWASAFGVLDFDLYVGGRDPGAVHGVLTDTPAIVVGAGVNAPLSPHVRGRLARELLAMRRGTAVAQHRDDTTLTAIVVAACRLAKVITDAPQMAVLSEVERLLGRAMSGKVKTAIKPICKAIVDQRVDARAWAGAARASLLRVATVASGDASVTLGDLFGEPLQRVPQLARDDLRAEELLRFSLSAEYVEVRRALGLEGKG